MIFPSQTALHRRFFFSSAQCTQALNLEPKVKGGPQGTIGGRGEGGHKRGGEGGGCAYGRAPQSVCVTLGKMG